MVSDTPHDLPDRGPDLVVTMPRPDLPVMVEIMLSRAAMEQVRRECRAAYRRKQRECGWPE